jgi:hypothetical protein
MDGAVGRLFGVEPDRPALQRPAAITIEIHEIAGRLGLQRGHPDVDKLDRLSG